MAQGFIKVAELGDLEEGTLYPLEVDGEPICLTKVNGTVLAFTDNCTHISGPLNQGEFDGCIVTCPWHLAQFDVRTGKVLRGPARQDLYTYTVKIEGEAIFIDLPPED
jgi:3-phenylpropionate/trans-cinnamate dioxygenase ferredoxin subunit